jgi:hypothetical protein
MNYFRSLLLISTIFFFACKESSDRIYLFNGHDLENWDTYLGRPQSELEVPYLDIDENGHYTEIFGLNNDPMEVFSVMEEDGINVIRISGYVWGGLITKEEYENYHIHLEYKWGELKHPPREELPRNSGLCYHSVGKYGVFWTFWMRSCELEIMEGGLGDFVRVDQVFANINAEFDSEISSPGYRYSAEGETTEVNYNTYKIFAGDDYEYTVGQWNSIDLYTFNQDAIHIINDQIVIHAEEITEMMNSEKVPLTKGKIQLQSEGAEIFYRNIYIEPINKLPDIR